MNKSGKKDWLKWLKLQRIIPLVTVLETLFALGLAKLGLLVLSIPEAIMLSLLGLIAVDALIERMNILEKIQLKLGIQEDELRLRWEPNIFEEVPFDKYLFGVKELFISGGSLIGLMTNKRIVLQNWLNNSREATIRFILINPIAVQEGKVPVESLHIDQNRDDYVKDIERSLSIITSLQKEFPNKISIHLTEQTPSLTVMIRNKKDARIALNLFASYPDKRPAFEISRVKNPEWFALFYEKYYENLWKDNSVNYS